MPRAGAFSVTVCAALCACMLLACSSAAPGRESEPATSRAEPPPVPPGASADVVRGRYLAMAGDCMACHTAAHGRVFAGGRPIGTPFGTVLSANLTPDRQTGIGSWTSDQFYRAIHQGIDDDGHHLYPAFPFDYYTKVTRQDSDSIYDYLRTLAPVSNALQRDHLNFPFNIRGALVLWRWLYFKPGQFRPDPRQSAAWNRGAYLVQGLGHCGACHTPRSALGGPKRDQFLHGGAFQHWFAPDLTTDKRTGLGSWSRADIATYLREGRNARAEAAGEMGEVVAFSTSRLSDADRTAIVTYLTSIGPSSAPQNSAPPAQTMRRGGAIFVDACSACHGMDGRGQPGFFPPLAGSANAQQRDPTNSIRFILAGVRATPTDAHPSPLTMPPFDWKLNDEDVAAVATYVRNSWGNNAPSVSANDVNRLRRVLPSSQSARQPLQSSASRPNPMSLNPSSGD